MSADRCTVVYGDFWYPGGIRLADRIADGEIEMPQAVICASDHMAIGLANRLAERGISVPEQIIVTGFDATQEAAVNKISITTAVPAVDEAAARAVDEIRGIIEPGAKPTEYHSQLTERLVKSSSCGCCEDSGFWRMQFKSTQYYTSYTFDSADFRRRGNITLLMESHMLEKLSGAYSPQDCLEEIYKSTYLILPYSNFYLCLREDWLDTETEYTVGYPKRMKTVVHTTPKENTGFFDENGRAFDAALMLPELYSDENEPSVCLFSPVHFNEEMLGYTVLQCSYESTGDLNLLVYRNWLRNINCALEITRARNRLISLSTHDGMTGLYNRLGMKHYLKRSLRHAGADKMLLAYVVDMDGLKNINDNYGHSEGDYGIITISHVLSSIVKENEIAIRAGGDEFYILGAGRYSEAEESERAKRLIRLIDLADKNSNKPYKISASVGYVIRPITGAEDIEGIIAEADSLMYRNKTARKFQRRE